MSSYNNFSRGYSSRRRASPTYDDYDAPSPSQSSTQRPPSPSYNPVPENRHENYGNSTYFEGANSSNYNSNSYSNYRTPQRPWEDIQPPQHRNLNYHEYPPRSRSPPRPPPSLSLDSFPASSLPHRLPHRRRTVSPASVARTEPTPEYMLTAETPSKQLQDPTSSRKLLVLDLNGSLLVRSPHRKPATLPRNAPYDPYAEPTRPRALRSVHPRPYMCAFRDYLFHEETKGWLDTMVWSSAQPHSVGDMVDKAFGKRKNELKAVWARDTLGLSSDQYHQKTQTTKDLAKPWAEIPALRPSATSSSTSIEDTREAEANVVSQSHSAHTTLLMDDSPLKAILQPFNHLCISEYTNDMRKKDLEILEIQTFKQKKANEYQNSMKSDVDELNEFTESVQHEEALGDVHKLSKSLAKEENAPEQEKKDRKKEKKKREQERKRKDKEDELLAKIEALSGEKPVSSSSASSTEIPDHLEADGAVGIASLGYDSTLLAAIGILEHIKHEDNVAAWMKSGGLVRIPGLEGVPVDEIKPDNEDNVSVTKDDTTTGEGKGTPVVNTPTDMLIDNQLGDSLNTTTTLSARDHSPPSHDGTPVPTKKRRISDDLELKSSSSDPSTPAAAVTSDGPHTTTTSAPGTELEHTAPVPENDDAPQKQWFENPAVLAYWAEKGRFALHKLGIAVQSGVAS